jgi:hypothetical protein
LYYQQVNHEQRFLLETDEVLPFHWPDRNGIRELSISVGKGNKWTWSGGLNLNSMGDTYLKLLNTSKAKEYFLRVEIKPDDKGSILIIFRPKSSEIYPYKIVNATNRIVTFYQVEVQFAMNIFVKIFL